MPKVSVIIPVYNTEKYLRRCLDSICNQTLKDIEIICVNDCSPDNSSVVLEEYAQKDNRVRVISFEENKGVSVARNAGIRAATGEYIGFVDSDDFVDLDFYEKLYDATDDGIDIVKGNIKSWGENADITDLVLSHLMSNGADIQRNKANFIYAFGSAIFRWKLVVDYDIFFPEELFYFEDPCFTIKAVIFSNGVRVVNQVFYHYVNNPTSVTRVHSNIPGKLECSKKALDYVLDLLDVNNVNSAHYAVVFARLAEDIGFKITGWKDCSHILFDYQQYIWQRCRYPEECSKAYVHQCVAYKKELMAGLRSKIISRRCGNNSSAAEETCCI